MKKAVIWALVAVLVAGGIAGTALMSQGSDGGDTHGGTAHVALHEWHIAGAHGKKLSLPSGKVTIEIHNEGVTEHVLALWKGGRVEGDTVIGGMLVAQSEVVGPGKLTILEAELEDGVEYILTCPIPGHTAAGMAVTVTADGDEGHTHEGESHEHEAEEHHH